MGPRGSALTIFRVAPAVRSAALDQIAVAIDAGSGPGVIHFYDGPMPANTSTATISANHLLGTLTCADPSASSAANGVLTLAAIAADPNADASGTVSFVRVCDSDGAVVCDADVGIAGATVTVPNAEITAGEPIQISSFMITWP